MSEIISNIFGRSRNDAPTVAAPVAAHVTVPKVADTVATETDETVEPMSDAVATEDGVEDPAADSDAESTDDAEAEELTDEEAPGDEATDDEVTAEEDASDEGDEDDGEIEEEVDPAATESDDAPADDEADGAGAPEADADETEEPETYVDAVDAHETETQPAVAEARSAAATRGNTTVDEGVISKIVITVVRKVEGVHDLDDEGTSVDVDSDVATIKVALVVDYGHPIKALGERLRVEVIDAVEEILGLDVASVDIHVVDIYQPETI